MVEGHNVKGSNPFIVTSGVMEEEVRDVSWVGHIIIGALIRQREPILPTELWEKVRFTGIDQDDFFAVIFEFIRAGVLKQSYKWTVSLNRMDTYQAYM